MCCCHAGGEEQVQLEVTDGWYSVSASIDGPLRHYLASGVLRTGQPCPSGACRQSGIAIFK